MDRRERALRACGAVARTITARRSRFGPDGLHWFVLLAHPRPGARRTQRSGGAYVSAWIDFRLHEGALLLAKHYVRQRGWRVRSVIEHRWFDRLADVAPRARRWFREARAEGACFVWHQYPRAVRRG